MQMFQPYRFHTHSYNMIINLILISFILPMDRAVISGGREPSPMLRVYKVLLNEIDRFPKR